jgi:hypothetical protein
MVPTDVASIIPELAAPPEVVAVIRRHRDFVELFRLMKARLGLTNEFIDAAVGLTAGHCDKILGPSQCRNFGPAVFDAFCGLFAIEFFVRIDLEAAERMRAIWEVRKKPLCPNGKVARMSKALIERAKPFVIKANCRAANQARNAILTCEQKTAISRHAAKVRWAKHRKCRRGCVAPSTG